MERILKGFGKFMNMDSGLDGVNFDDDDDDDDDDDIEIEKVNNKSFNSFKETANVKDTPILQKIQENKKSSSKTRSSILEAHRNRRKK